MKLAGWKKGNEDILKTFSEKEIVLKDLFNIFWERRAIVVAAVPLLWVIAVIQIATTPHTYTCSSTYITEGSGNAGNLQGGVAELFGLSGANLSGSSGTFSDPGFYPSIIGSRPFLGDLMAERFQFRTLGEEMSLEQFSLRYDERNLVKRLLGPVLSIPGRVISWFERKPKEISDSEIESITSADSVADVSPILNLSREQINAMNNINNRIEIIATGSLIEVETKMPDPIVSAQFNQIVSQKLLDFIITRETEKERRDLAYVERRVETAQLNFERSQRVLAQFRDGNRGVVSAEAKTEEERLQANYSIYFGIYQRLATELEEKKIALEEKTPIYTVFEPVYVPREPDSRGSFKILIIYSVLGVFVGVLVVSVVIFRALFKKQESF